MSSGSEPGLLGREVELGAIARAVASAANGTGGTLVLEGPAGIGKTTLTAAALGQAQHRGLRALSARGNDGEAGLPFGVVRQLLETPLHHEPSLRESVLTGSAALAEGVLFPGNGAAEVSEPFAVLHGLFWVCSNLAEEQPLLLVIDDVHWADAASVRFVQYLANRVADLPCLLLLGHRTGEVVDDALPAVFADARTEVLALGPLGETEAAVVIRELCGAHADDAFCRACHQATGGNPFLLRELARTTVQERIAPVAASVPQVARVTPAAVLRSVTARLDRLPRDARLLAEGIAVAGPQSDQHLAGLVAGLPPEAASAAADALAAAGLITGARQLDFVHPLLRTAVYEQLGPGRRAQAHALAADALAGTSGPGEQAATHLLHVPPAGDPRRARILVRAGEDAIGRGAPEAAVGYLKRALAEPPASAERGGVLFDLGRSEAMLAARESLGHLSEAMELAPGVEEKVAILRETAYAMAANFGLMEDAVATIGQAHALVAGHGTELELQLHAEQATWAALSDAVPMPAMLAEIEEAARGLTGATAGERGMLAILAWCRAASGRPPSQTTDLAVTALAEGRILADFGVRSLTAGQATWALAYTLAGAELDPIIQVMSRSARREASRHGIGLWAWPAAYVAHRHGRLGDAEAYLREALDVLLEVGSVGLAMALGTYLEVLTDLRGADAAWQELEALGYLGDLPPIFPFAALQLSRGVVRVHRGDIAGAKEDIAAAGAVYRRWGVTSPAVAPWRSAAAAAHLRAGETEVAAVLLTEELELARAAELPFEAGRALRLLARCEPDAVAIERLRESVGVLQATDLRLEHAHALIDLGAALRRANRRGDVRVDLEEARTALRLGVDLAHRCAASPLIRTGQAELRATGARPRRLLSTGPDSLTASERRVAQLAAEGLSNREIAAALFVTLKTVEKHLGNTYAKLEIESRAGLGRALAAVTDQG